MKKLFLIALVALGLPAAAGAHPLGNFTVNRYAELVASGDRLYLRYVLDLAEIPTFQEGDRVRAAGFPAALARRIEIRVDGRRAPLRVLDSSVGTRPGAGEVMYRFVTSFATSAAEIDRFGELIA